MIIVDHLSINGPGKADIAARRRLVTVCEHWRCAVEAMTFRFIWDKCKTDEDVKLLCSTIERRGRVSHLRDLVVDLRQVAAIDCVAAIRKILTLLSRLDEYKEYGSHPGVGLKLYMSGKYGREGVHSQLEAIERALLPPFPQVNAIRALKVNVVSNPSTLGIANRLVESAPCAMHPTFKFYKMPQEVWHGKHFPFLNFVVH
ncbi:hypothetical protein PG985_001609 [Apiospora marii]|uniref:Uncharacterized protein n=1 Tax=Apiospora marii TaxID=335849 RepID=A0ABR1RIH5_9PEZI